MSDSKNFPWQTVLAVLGAAAGLAAWVSLVGSAVVGVRLDTAGLPVESVVALMSTEHRFAIGAGALIAPMFVGAAGLLVDWLVISRSSKRSTTPGSRRTTPPSDPHHASLLKHRSWSAVAIIVLVATIGELVLRPRQPWLFAYQSAALLIIVLGVLRVCAKRQPWQSAWKEHVTVFALAIAAAGVIAYCYERWTTAVFDAAEVQLRDAAAPIHGGYITTTDTSVLLVTSDAHDCLGVSAVRRDQIEHIRIGAGRFRVTDWDRDRCTSPQDLGAVRENAPAG